MATRSPLVAPAVTEAIRAAGLDDRDKGLAMLARRYAAVIDDAERAMIEALSGRNRSEKAQLRAEAARTLVDLGPKLQAALTSLGLTPAARAAATRGTVVGDSTASEEVPRDVIAEYRARAAARRTGAAG